MPHDDRLSANQDEASKAGIPGFGEVHTAAVFEDLQVFVMPLLHMSQEVFIHAAEHLGPVGASLFVEGPANTFRMGFLPWDQILGTVIEMPCACAFQVITSFAEQVIPYGHSWEMGDGGTMDIPEPEPVDLSDARGWELAISLMRATEESLLAAFRAVSRADPYYGYFAANALQALATWRPSLLDVKVFLRCMADPLVSHSDLSQLPFSSRFTHGYKTSPETSTESIHDIPAHVVQ
jgi:hypothetical protein